MAIIVANDGSRFVDTMAERDSIPVNMRFMGMRVTVKDATADPVFGGGVVQYLWDKTVGSWSPVWSDKKPELKFSTEEKIIAAGRVTTDHVIKDALVWSARVVDLSGVILGDAQLVIEGKDLVLNTQDYNGMKLHYTYAYGEMTTELIEIWQQKANTSSPTFTGNPKAPTPIPTSNDTSIATTEFVKDALAGNESGIADAPTDGKDYVRNNGAWKPQVVAFDTYSLKSSVSASGALVINATTQQSFVVTNKSAGTRQVSFADGPAGRMVTCILLIDGNTGDITFAGANLKWNEGKAVTKAEFGAARTQLIFLWDGIDTWCGSKGAAY